VELLEEPVPLLATGYQPVGEVVAVVTVWREVDDVDARRVLPQVVCDVYGRRAALGVGVESDGD
jgi:hypothetical protein